MALNAYTAGPTAAQIAAQVEALAGQPNLHLHPTTLLAPTTPTEFAATLAYRALNEILVGLYTEYEWPFLATGANVTISARENALPTDFWRVQFPEPLILLDQGSRYILQHLDPKRAYHDLPTPTGTDRPARFWIDRNRSSYFVDPIPGQSYTGEFHYYKYIARLTATTDVPQFPHPDLLEAQLLAWTYKHQDDTRYAIAAAEAGAMLQRIRSGLDDERDGDAAIPLDTSCFRSVNYDAPPW